MLVHQKTAHILSFQSLLARQNGEEINSSRIQQLKVDDERLVLMGQTNICTIRFLTERIHEIEKAVLAEAKLKTEYEKLLTVPGIGKILALASKLAKVCYFIMKEQVNFDVKKIFG